VANAAKDSYAAASLMVKILPSTLNSEKKESDIYVTSLIKDIKIF